MFTAQFNTSKTARPGILARRLPSAHSLANILRPNYVDEMSSQAEASLMLAEGALGLLDGDERRDAERLLSLCRERWSTSSNDAPPPSAPEIRQLSEFLARRGAKAMPFGALGRALLADLHGSPKDCQELLIEFQLKLSMLGI